MDILRAIIHPRRRKLAAPPVVGTNGVAPHHAPERVDLCPSCGRGLLTDLPGVEAGWCYTCGYRGPGVTYRRLLK